MIDRNWSPDPYAARNTIQTPSDRAGELLRNLHPQLASAVASAKAAPIGRLQRGPRAQYYTEWYPQSGRYCGMSLHKRVAMRRAMHGIREYEASRMINPAAAAEMGVAGVMHKLADKLEAKSLAFRADTSYRSNHHG